MPWWSCIYLIVMVGFDLAGIVDDLRSGKRLLGTTLIFSMLARITFVMLFFQPAVFALPLSVVVLLLVFSFAVEFFSLAVDMADSMGSPDPELSAKENKGVLIFAEVFYGCLVLPSLFAGAAIILRGV